MLDRTSRAVTSGILIAMLATAVPACMAAGVQVTEKKLAATEESSWQLSGAKVIRTGEISEIDDGTITNGYTVESDAIAQGGGALIPKGKFKMMATVFSPKKDKPGQQAGRWYLRGSWSITGESTGQPMTKARHAPTTIKGDLTADLSFNPATTQGSVEAQVKMPKMPVGSRLGAGNGTFSGNERFEGNLSLTLTPRPQMKKR